MKTTIFDARRVLVKWIVVFFYPLHLVLGQYALVKSLEWMPLNQWVNQSLIETQRISLVFFEMKAFLRFLYAFRGLMNTVLVSQNVGLQFRATLSALLTPMTARITMYRNKKVTMNSAIHALQKDHDANSPK